MKPTIVAKNKYNLLELIQEEIGLNGYACDLNHIDVSKMTSMKELFSGSHFNGDISQWDTSNVTDMSFMFWNSEFRGDISQWDTSKVVNMSSMFRNSKFNGDISPWNVSNVEDMSSMFSGSKFIGDNGNISKWNVSNLVDTSFTFFKSKFKSDISDWKPYKLGLTIDMFGSSPSSVPYWYHYEDDDKDSRKKAIDSYWLSKELGKELSENSRIEKKIKI